MRPASRFICDSLKAHPKVIVFRYMDKKMNLKLNGGRTVTGILRGFDPFMNVVIDDTVEECKDGSRNNIGMVVSRINMKI